MAKKGKALTEKQSLIRAADFIVLNSLLFHIILAGHFGGVKPLSKIQKGNAQAFLISEWEKVIRDINFLSVFSLGLEILKALPPSPDTEIRLAYLADITQNIASSGVLKRSDFLGELYHKLLLRVTGHHYATYYTTQAAAHLLAAFARYSSPKLNDFSVDSIEKVKIIDPACGSGSLLKALYLEIEKHHIFKSGSKASLPSLHKALIEEVLHGWDVLDFAGHLTATSLGVLGGGVPSVSSKIYVLPADVKSGSARLGSIDYLKSGTLAGLNLSPAATKKTAKGGKETLIPIENYDIVIMNPPFSRSSKQGTIFGYLPPGKKEKCQKALKELAKERDIVGAGQGGLGPFFLDLADELAADDGVIAAVLPRSILSSVSYSKLRSRLMQEYDLRAVISNFDDGSKSGIQHPWAWSSHTDLGEVLVIFSKKKKDSNENCIHMNILQCPNGEMEASSLFSHVENKMKNDISISNSLYKTVNDLNDRVIAYFYTSSQEEKGDNWLLLNVFAMPEINKMNFEIQTSKQLGSLHAHLIPTGGGKFFDGYDIAAVKANFNQSKSPTGYRVLWGHQSDMNTLELSDKKIGYGSPKKPASASKHSQKSSALLLADRVHMKTESLICMRTPQPVLSTALWELSANDESSRRLLLLWYASTYGICNFLGNSICQKADEFALKKGQMQNLRVPHSGSIEIEKIDKVYDAVKDKKFLAYQYEFERASKGKGPRCRLDKFFKSELKLPHISSEMYGLLAVDPTVTRKCAPY